MPSSRTTVAVSCAVVVVLGVLISFPTRPLDDPHVSVPHPHPYYRRMEWAYGRVPDADSIAAGAEARAAACSEDEAAAKIAECGAFALLDEATVQCLSDGAGRCTCIRGSSSVKSCTGTCWERIEATLCPGECTPFLASTLLR